MESPPSLRRQRASSLSPPLPPQVARQFPEPMPVVLKTRLGGTPVAILHADKATLRLQPFVEVLATASNSAFNSLFSLNVVSGAGWWGWRGGCGLSRRPHVLPVSSFALFSPRPSPC